RARPLQRRADAHRQEPAQPPRPGHGVAQGAAGDMKAASRKPQAASEDDSGNLPLGACRLELPPLAAYVHIPWCVRKCPYCDFNSHAAGPQLPEDEYVAALLADLDEDFDQVQGRRLGSIFFGGGTPSLLSAQALGRILEGLEQRVGFAEGIEITLEANPGTFEQAKFHDYRRLGINRLSIGVQSFQPAKLKALGRIHDGNEAIRAADMARAAGFDNFNLDLMHGLPDQTLEDALHDLRTAIAQRPTHQSWYQPTLEPNTGVCSTPTQLPEGDILWNIQQAGHALLAEHGYEQYETSAYAQPGRQARHNLNYWTFGDFLGLGAGAHGKLSSPDGTIRRTWNTRLPKDYLDPAKAFQAGNRVLESDELPFEFLMNVLRLTRGVPVDLFCERTGLSLKTLN